MGPPMTRRAGDTVKPPQNATRSATRVPIGTSTLAGSRTAAPLTVTTRETSGRPSRTA